MLPLTDTTEFLKNLNIYQGIVQIDETIRKTTFKENQLEILLREENEDTPTLQVFINAAINYAITVLKRTNVILDVSN